MQKPELQSKRDLSSLSNAEKDILGELGAEEQADFLVKSGFTSASIVEFTQIPLPKIKDMEDKYTFQKKVNQIVSMTLELEVQSMRAEGYDNKKIRKLVNINKLSAALSQIVIEIERADLNSTEMIQEAVDEYFDNFLS